MNNSCNFALTANDQQRTQDFTNVDKSVKSGRLKKLSQAEDMDLHINETNYNAFQKAVQDFLRHQNESPPKVVIERMNRPIGPVESLSQIIQSIQTPIIYLAQDDFGLRININTTRIATTMINAARGYNNVRHILLGWGNSGKKLFFVNSTASSAKSMPLLMEVEEAGWSQRASSFVVESVCLDESLLPYRVQFFCDHNHFALTESIASIYFL